MDRPLLNHFQWLVVILHYNMPAIQVGVKPLKAKAHRKTFPLNVSVVSLDISKSFTGKGYGATTLYVGSTYPILASVCHSM